MFLHFLHPPNVRQFYIHWKQAMPEYLESELAGNVYLHASHGILCEVVI